MTEHFRTKSQLVYHLRETSHGSHRYANSQAEMEKWAREELDNVHAMLHDRMNAAQQEIKEWAR